MKPYYQDDLVTIYHADCRDVLPTLLADAIVTDPPYGVGIDYGLGVDDSQENWRKLMSEVIPIFKAMSSFSVLPCCRIAELEWIYANFPPDWLICWHKGSPGTRAKIGFNDWEPHLVYGKPNSPMHDFFHAIPEPHNSGHPCPKPMAWARWLVKRSVPSMGILCDPFCGTGTTLRAAKDTERYSIGIEINERYCEIAARRCAQEVMFTPEAQ